MILLAASPRYFADSMNNPKDLPFAAMSVAALYYFSTISPTWPYISRGTAIKIVVALALALNIRASALLYLGYLAVLMFIIIDSNLRWRQLADTAIRLAAMAVAVLVLGTVFWPWAQRAPLTRPLEALLSFAGAAWSGAVLFNGRDYAATDLPWYYAPEWLLISTPPVVIVGAILSMFVWRRGGWTLSRTALWATAVLPVLLVIIKDSTLYDGIRHLLSSSIPFSWSLPPRGWTAWLSESSRPWQRRGVAVLLVAGLVNILAFHVRFHPNQAVYFNELVGGPRGAFGRFDMDYWGNCILEAVAWSAKTGELSGSPIAISGVPWPLVQLDVQRFPQLVFTAPNRDKHHLAVVLNRGSVKGVTELANRADALYQVRTADGAVLCVVLPGPAFAELRGHLALLHQHRRLTRERRGESFDIEQEIAEHAFRKVAARAALPALRRPERRFLCAALFAARWAGILRLGPTAVLLRRGSQERRGVWTATVLEPLVLRRERAVAEPAGCVSEPRVSADCDDVAGAGHEGQYRASLLGQLHWHAPAPHPSDRAFVPAVRCLSGLNGDSGWRACTCISPSAMVGSSRLSIFRCNCSFFFVR